MKSINKSFGVLSFVVLFIASVFKLNHWPGANIMFTVGSISLVGFFLIFLIKAVPSLSAGIEKASGISGGLMMMLLILGFLFKMNHWPGANILIICSNASMLFAGIIFLIDSIKESDKAKESIKMLLAYTLLAVSLAVFLLGTYPMMSS